MAVGVVRRPTRTVGAAAEPGLGPGHGRAAHTAQTGSGFLLFLTEWPACLAVGIGTLRPAGRDVPVGRLSAWEATRKERVGSLPTGRQTRHRRGISAGISIPPHPLSEGLTRSRVGPRRFTDLAGRAGRDVPVRAGLGSIGRAERVRSPRRQKAGGGGEQNDENTAEPGSRIAAPR